MLPSRKAQKLWSKLNDKTNDGSLSLFSMDEIDEFLKDAFKAGFTARDGITERLTSDFDEVLSAEIAVEFQ